MLHSISASKINDLVDALETITGQSYNLRVSENQPISKEWFNDFSRIFAQGDSSGYLQLSDNALIQESLFIGQNYGILLKAYNKVKDYNILPSNWLPEDWLAIDDSNIEYSIENNGIYIETYQYLIDKLLNFAYNKVGIIENTPQHHALIDLYNKGAAKYGYSQGSYNVSWCAMFVSACLYYAGVAQYTGMTPSTGVFIHFSDRFSGTKNSWLKWISNTENDGYESGSINRIRAIPQPGDLVVYDWSDDIPNGHDHIGLVYQNNGNGTMTTIEGNVSNQVQQIYRTWDTINSPIQGYLRPDYQTIATLL